MKPELILEQFLNDRTRERRDAAIEAYRFLCARAARKFIRRGTDYDDLLQVAAVGLIKAVEHYDRSYATPFEGYAWILIVGELMHFARDTERLIRIPRSLRALERRFDLVVAETTRTEGRYPAPSEIAREMSVSLTVVDRIRRLQLGEITSFDGADGTRDIEDAGAYRISMEDRLALSLALAELADRERLVVLGSFAAGYTQAEIGMHLGLSQSHVSKLLKRALRKMQRAVA